MTSRGGRDRGGAGSGSSRGRRSTGPSPRSRRRARVAWLADRFATSMWRRARRSGGSGPVVRGQQAISMLSKPLAAVQSTTSMSGVSGNGAVSRPSLIGVVRRRVARTRRRRARVADDVDPAPSAGALGDGVVDEHLVVAVGERRVGRAGRPAGRRRHRRRPPGNGRANVSPKPSTWPTGQRRGRPAGRAHERRVPDAGSRWAARDGRSTAGRAAPSPRRPTRADPSISYWSEFFRPALIWRCSPRRGRRSRSAAGSSRRPRSRSSRVDGLGGELGREGLDRAGRLAARLDERRQLGHHRDDPLAGDERHQVEPVRADVADRPERAAALGLRAASSSRSRAAASPGSSGR